MICEKKNKTCNGKEKAKQFPWLAIAAAAGVLVIMRHKKHRSE